MFRSRLRSTRRRSPPAEPDALLARRADAGRRHRGRSQEAGEAGVGRRLPGHGDWCTESVAAEPLVRAPSGQLRRLRRGERMQGEKAPKNAPPPKTFVLKQTVNVPDFWNGELSTSSVSSTSASTRSPAPLNRNSRRNGPTRWAPPRFFRREHMKLSKQSELSTLLSIYNPKGDSANKPDMTSNTTSARPRRATNRSPKNPAKPARSSTTRPIRSRSTARHSTPAFDVSLGHRFRRGRRFRWRGSPWRLSARNQGGRQAREQDDHARRELHRHTRHRSQTDDRRGAGGRHPGVKDDRLPQSDRGGGRRPGASDFSSRGRGQSRCPPAAVKVAPRRARDQSAAWSPDERVRPIRRRDGFRPGRQDGDCGHRPQRPLRTSHFVTRALPGSSAISPATSARAASSSKSGPAPAPCRRLPFAARLRLADRPAARTRPSTLPCWQPGSATGMPRKPIESKRHAADPDPAATPAFRTIRQRRG